MTTLTAIQKEILEILAKRCGVQLPDFTKEGNDDGGFTLSTERAPAGGIIVNGRHFRGGMFIPSSALKEMTPEQKQKLHEAQAAAKAKRAARGPVDVEKLHARTAGHGQLSDAERKHAEARLRAIGAHHGELTLHRLEELADQAEKVLGKVKDDLVLGGRARRELASLNHMIAQERARPKEPAAAEKPAEQPPPEPPAEPAAPPPEQPAAAPEAKGETKINLSDSRALAAAIHEEARHVPDAISGAINSGDLPEWQSHKPLLSDVYEKLKPRLGGASLEDFKKAVMQAHLKGDLVLARNDMPQAVKGEKSYERVQASETPHPLGANVATFHTVNTNSPAARKGEARSENVGQTPVSPLDNTSPKGDNKGSGTTQPKPEEPKMTTQELTRDEKILASHEEELRNARQKLENSTREDRAFWKSEVERLEARLPTLQSRAEKSRKVISSAGATQPKPEETKMMAQELPKLTGSEKQIAWAEKIRAEKVAEAKRWLDTYTGQAQRDPNEPRHQESADAYRAALELAHSEASSKFWIDNRDKSLRAIVDAQHKERNKTGSQKQLEFVKAAASEVDPGDKELFNAFDAAEEALEEGDKNANELFLHFAALLNDRGIKVSAPKPAYTKQEEEWLKTPRPNRGRYTSTPPGQPLK